ncbi:MAG: hypothetical protein KC425_22320 [Anaerolineales bacterium]|nr:hypothetical protein [Anaerolineales bacterium]
MLTDQRVVAAADDAVVVHVGLYSRGTGERETAVGPDGAAWADSAVVIPVGR